MGDETESVAARNIEVISVPNEDKGNLNSLNQIDGDEDDYCQCKYFVDHGHTDHCPLPSVPWLRTPQSQQTQQVIVPPLEVDNKPSKAEDKTEKQAWAGLAAENTLDISVPTEDAPPSSGFEDKPQVTEHTQVQPPTQKNQITPFPPEKSAPPPELVGGISKAVEAQTERDKSLAIEKGPMAKNVLLQRPTKHPFETELIKISYKPLWKTRTRVPAILQYIQYCMETANSEIRTTEAALAFQSESTILENTTHPPPLSSVAKYGRIDDRSTLQQVELPVETSVHKTQAHPPVATVLSKDDQTSLITAKTRTVQDNSLMQTNQQVASLPAASPEEKIQT